MKLYLVHCGFYDSATSFGGVYEGHTNLFLVAESAQEARTKAKSLEIYQEKRMHIDGIQEINVVEGYRVALVKDAEISGHDDIQPHIFRDLTPIKSSS